MKCMHRALLPSLNCDGCLKGKECVIELGAELAAFFMEHCFFN